MNATTNVVMTANNGLQQARTILENMMLTLNKALQACGKTTSGVLCLLYGEEAEMMLEIRGQRPVKVKGLADIVSALYDSRLLGGSFEHDVRMIEYAPGRIEGFVVGSVGRKDEVRRCDYFRRLTVKKQSGYWKIMDDCIFVFPLCESTRL